MEQYDPPEIIEKVFSENIRKKFEIYSYRNAATILSNSFPLEFSNIVGALGRFKITSEMIRLPGGSKGLITKYVEALFPEPYWVETRITADLHVRLEQAKIRGSVYKEYVRTGFLDGHRIDFVSNKVALDLEWNSKDQTFDRDLYAFSTFYNAGAIDVGIILTRGESLDNEFFSKLGKVLENDGTEGKGNVAEKFGASTTSMTKLLPRLNAGRNGGCPILAVGITPECINGSD